MQLLVGARAEFIERLAAVFQQVVELALVGIVLRRLHGELEAVAERLQLQRIELLLFHQHLLADADFAEVVQQRGVTDLADLIGAEVNVAILLVVTVDDARQLDGEIGDAEGVTGCGRIALFDRSDRRGDEPFEEALDRLVEQVVLDRDRRLCGERAHQLDRLRVEGDDLVRHRGRGQLRGAPGFLRLMSCSTPTSSPTCVTIGKTRIDRVR